jgi:hypothetical protein
MFQEAKDHSRHKEKMERNLESFNIAEYAGKSWEEILQIVDGIHVDRPQMGKLATYDISAAIARYYEIKYEKVYIIGGGPRKACKVLGLVCKRHKVNRNVFHYVEIDDLKNAMKIDSACRNGDAWETFLCEWSKTN